MCALFPILAPKPWTFRSRLNWPKLSPRLLSLRMGYIFCFRCIIIILLCASGLLSNSTPHRCSYQALRSADRKQNEKHYPELCYPDIYLLDGGYKAFFDSFKVRGEFPDGRCVLRGSGAPQSRGSRFLCSFYTSTHLEYFPHSEYLRTSISWKSNVCLFNFC